MRPLISVVIPSYERPELLKRCLAALENQHLDKSLFEIIVVEDKKRQGPAFCRNIGWRKAQSEIIAFTDDDTIPDKNWLRFALYDFKAGASVVCGKVIVPVSKPLTDYERNTKNLETAEFLTANLFIKKNILKKIGGFDERFTAAYREDSDLQFRLIEGGMKITKSEKVKVFHPVRKVSYAVSLFEQKKSIFNALLFKKHPALYIRKIQKLPPFLYYFITLSLILTLKYYIFFIVFLFLTFFLIYKRIRDVKLTLYNIADISFTSFLIPSLSIFWRIRGALKYRVLFF